MRMQSVAPKCQCCSGVVCIFGFSNDSRGIEHTTPRTWFAMPSTACKENYLPGDARGFVSDVPPHNMSHHDHHDHHDNHDHHVTIFHYISLIFHYISLNMSLYFRLFDQRISGKHHRASSTTESSGLVT